MLSWGKGLNQQNVAFGSIKSWQWPEAYFLLSAIALFQRIFYEFYRDYAFLEPYIAWPLEIQSIGLRSQRNFHSLQHIFAPIFFDISTQS